MGKIVRHEFDKPEGDDLAEQIAQALKDKINSILSHVTEAEKDCVKRLNEYVPTDRLLTLEEAAAYLHFSVKWLNAQTKPGKTPTIPYVMIGTDKRFRKSALDARLEEIECKPKKLRP